GLRALLIGPMGTSSTYDCRLTLRRRRGRPGRALRRARPHWWFPATMAAVHGKGTSGETDAHGGPTPPDRSVPDPGPARRRRDGRGLPRPARDLRRPGRGEGAAPGQRRGSAAAGAATPGGGRRP